MNKFLPFLVLFLLCFNTKAQNFGGVSPKLQWKVTESKWSNIIYNPENEKIAFQVQGILLRMQKQHVNIGPKRKKIKLILRSQNSVSNGFVSLAPFKSEFYLTPNSDNFTLGTLNWPYLLATHEYQHVLQFSNTLYGISRLAFFIGGELTWGSLQTIITPNWFLEGDAVRAETEYTQQGRGRVPAFLNGYRELAFKNTFYSYQKARNGSLKDVVPNHYPLGYLMVKYGRDNYGENFWPTVLKQTSQLKGLLYPFSRALKRNSGLKVKRFYTASMTDYANQLPSELPNIIYPDLIPKSKKEIRANATFSNFALDEKSGLQYIHYSSFDRTNYIYELDSNLEIQNKHFLAIRLSNYFDVYNQEILYAAKYVHPRWSLEDYNDLVIYDFKTGKTRRLTVGKRIFSPQFINDGKRIIAVKIQKSHRAHLIIYNRDGDVIQQFPNQENYYFTFPKQLNDSCILVGLRDTLGQTNLSIYNIKTNHYEHLLPWTFHQYGIPTFSKEKIYYSASYDGIDHLYCYDLKTKTLSQITSGKTSQYQAVYNQKSNELFFQNYQLNGSFLSKLNLDTITQNAYKIEPLKHVIKTSFSEQNTIPAFNNSDSLLGKKYHKAKHLLNLHSWSAQFNDPNYEFAIYSDDVLGTLSSSFGTTYNTNENGMGYFARMTYAQFYPIFDFGFSSTRRSALTTRSEKLYWVENDFFSQVQIPFNFSSRSYTKKLNIGAGYQFSKVNFDKESLANLQIQAINMGYKFEIKRLKAKKNIFTHLGFYFNLNYESSIDENELSQINLKNSIALPGIFQNHSFILDADFQSKNNHSNYNFEDNFNYARGISVLYQDRVSRVGFNYHLPLFYPDRGALGLVYLYRIRMNLFYDYTILNVYQKNYGVNTSGAEFIFDLNLFNAFPATIGLRYGFIVEGEEYFKNNQFFEVFIPVARF
ncbi:MAG: hypothetical protein DWP98_08465 [Bacteroidetes bacterium]|nr:MAG: hypothetical protein DWP98_08465 [Bacteroidota bacterium]MBL1145086.1 hypothetical protein [Bacteroidota bacterium]MCB0802123.1 hypothetical protein [Flavobacteriales bacterium]NOG57883.1 hypothetical protein [Bacteroidota bacterium]